MDETTMVSTVEIFRVLKDEIAGNAVRKVKLEREENRI